MQERIRRYLIMNEGYKKLVYRDTVGKATIGVGFNLERAGGREDIEALGLDYQAVLNGELELSDQQIQSLLDADIEMAVQAAKRVLPGFDDLSQARAIVAVDMIFNLGEQGFRGFRNCIAAMQRGDWAQAALEIEDSRYAVQVPNRARRNIIAMRDDELPEGI